MRRKIAGAEERIAMIEERIYKDLLAKINTRFRDLHAAASAVATADCLLSFAECAVGYGYVRPKIDDSKSLAITDGRHPVIERTMPRESLTSPTPSRSTATHAR